MNIQKLGAAQRGQFTQPSAGGPAQPGAATPASVGANRTQSTTGATSAEPTSAATPRDGMRRRIESFVEHADRRLEHLMSRTDLSKRQLDALQAAQERFHSQMGRLDRALDGGSANGAMQNILTGLRSSIHAVLGESPAQDGASGASSVARTAAPTRTIQGTNTSSQIDTLA